MSYERISTQRGRTDCSAQAGRQDAYAEIVERHSGTVYNLALRMMNDPQEAEEVLQETFISAFRALDRFEGRSQLSTWLYRIAYNAALMRLRKRRLPTTSIDEPIWTDEGDEMPRQLVDWRGLPDDLALSGEFRGVLDAAVGPCLRRCAACSSCATSRGYRRPKWPRCWG